MKAKPAGLKQSRNYLCLNHVSFAVIFLLYFFSNSLLYYSVYILWKESKSNVMFGDPRATETNQSKNASARKEC